MKKQVLSFAMAVCMTCLLTTTACSAAELPATQTDGFSDVPNDAWYAEAVAYCQQQGIMNGTSATTFAPEGTLTRAMLVTILWRQAERPVGNAPMNFSDVPESQ